jgi:hypothetical protein
MFPTGEPSAALPATQLFSPHVTSRGLVRFYGCEAVLRTCRFSATQLAGGGGRGVSVLSVLSGISSMPKKGAKPTILLQNFIHTFVHQKKSFVKQPSVVNK